MQKQVTYLILLAVTLVLESSAIPVEPFALGYSMANGGTILQQDNISGREAFYRGACFYGDTFKCGVSLAGVDYFDPMDNESSLHIARVGLGGFYTTHGFVLKAAYLHFDAMRIYYEQEGMVSLGYTRIPFLRASVELSGLRSGLYGNSDIPPLSKTELGFSAFVPFSVVALSFSASRIPLVKPQRSGWDSPLTLTTGLHTSANAFGGQGIVLTEYKNDIWNFRLTIGEEFFLLKNLACAAAVSTNPVMIHFGVTCVFGHTSVTAAFVDNPILGWSKGLAVNWAGGRSR
jgi:hypothetical protein